MRTEEFYKFIIERETIRLKRLVGGPYPWTKDPILRKFKFTNVKREHDKTSMLLKKEFYTPHYEGDREIILLNCAIARYFGTIEFMRTVGWQHRWNPEHIRKVANARMAAGERVFTGAYIITNIGIPGSKIDVVIDEFLADLWKQRKAVVKAAEELRWQPCVERLMQVRGFGGTGFMAKETILDSRYTAFWGGGQPTDKNTWTPVGPGSIRGASRTMNLWPRKVPKEMALDVCQQLFLARKKFWPKKFVELELTDIQFQLCEFDKYERVRLGEGRPRSLYMPKEIT